MAAAGLTLTPTELAAVVRLLGRGRSLDYALRLIETQRAVLTETRIDLLPRRRAAQTKDR